ncbi:MAG: Yip1 family protein [Candidatus Sericytochromatia bacterium]
MSDLFQTLFVAWFRPAELGARAHRAHWWQAAVLLWLTTSLHVLLQAGRAEWGQGQVFLGLLISWASSFFLWWLGTLLLHFSADLFGGRGRFADTMTATGLAVAPLVLLAPVAALPNVFGNFGYTLHLLAQMGLGFWCLALLVMSLSHAERFSLDRAVGAVVLSSVFAGALVGGAGLLLVFQFLFWLGQLPG